MVRGSVDRHTPPDLKSLVELAEAYQTAHKDVGKGNDKGQSSSDFQKKQQSKSNGNNQGQYKLETRTCFVCNRKGHIAPGCNLRNKQQGKIGLCLDKSGQIEPCSIVDENASGMTIRLPGVSCDEVKTNKVPGLDIVFFKICTRQELIDAQKSDHTLDIIRSYITNDSDEQSYFTYYRSCPECQRGVQKGRVSKSPLISIPPMDEPFQRIAKDFVGPLPLTENKNRYVLVCMDYATRYPEAFPLANQEAETVADTLIQLFSRVGVAKELFTDQGSNFMSDLMVQVSHHLLYDRHVRGPLAILKEEWEEPTDSDNSVLSYVLETRENLQHMTDLARQNEIEAKRKQKTYYDKKSRTRNLEVGQKVLVLLPTHTSKLLASWKGPYVITDKISLVDYKIKMKGTTEKIFHTNMLKLWYDRTDDLESSKTEVLACLDIISSLSSTDDEEDIDFNAKVVPVIEAKETIDYITIYEELSVEQKQQLGQLLFEYSDIFSDVLQVSDVIQHAVKTMQDR
ncbi:unnamed protein product [Mytilus coruscus]|uniref:Integrase catalytic domain-containing protein n=1 Tax=Mytilus coruscus TaxID=42192 RepID=A0A6J8D1Q9_MYTCO|nr:unnamed protein product [Mytilus coruscus]